MNGLIELSGMQFHAYHGCLEKERIEGNTFIVDFKAEIDLSDASVSDNLEDTLDYSKIYDIVKEQMMIPSNLLEHVAGRILRSIHLQFPYVPAFSVKVTKKAPPVSGEAESSSVTLFQGKFTV